MWGAWALSLLYGVGTVGGVKRVINCKSTKVVQLEDGKRILGQQFFIRFINSTLI
jgi:hypothetical protein